MVKRNIIFLILGLICILIILTHFLLNIDDDEGGSDEISIETDIVDKGEYWEISILENSGGKLNLKDARFTYFPYGVPVAVPEISIEDSNPEYIMFHYSTVYPIRGSITPIGYVYENKTNGDGEIIDSGSV